MTKIGRCFTTIGMNGLNANRTVRNPSGRVLFVTQSPCVDVQASEKYDGYSQVILENIQFICSPGGSAAALEIQASYIHP